MLISPIEVTENNVRRVVVAALPNWGLLGLAVFFFIAAYGVGALALYNGILAMAVPDSMLVYVIVLVLLHKAIYFLLAPLGTEQVYAFDKIGNRLTVTTRGMFRNKVDAYRLDQIVKLHFNRVDDGTYDKNTMLVIFKGGGTLQFPAHRSDPKRIENTVNVLARFLGVDRSDAPGKLDDEPAARRRKSPAGLLAPPPTSIGDSDVMDQLTRAG